MIGPLDEPTAMITRRDYVCSNCWHDLELKFAPNHLYFLICPNCGDDTKGYVTRQYAERRKQESMGDLMDAKQVLLDAKIIKNPNEGKKVEDVIKELGF